MAVEHASIDSFDVHVATPHQEPATVGSIYLEKAEMRCYTHVCNKSQPTMLIS